MLLRCIGLFKVQRDGLSVFIYEWPSFVKMELQDIKRHTTDGLRFSLDSLELNTPLEVTGTWPADISINHYSDGCSSRELHA
ncbi:hypothetical protein PM082_002113 [Marasmius tenuissimus]|nr:hypothetical protein PM082_002113 [Marasmius tenuissimus]